MHRLQIRSDRAAAADIYGDFVVDLTGRSRFGHEAKHRDGAGGAADGEHGSLGKSRQAAGRGIFGSVSSLV
jgi:hypothetical protein